MTAAIPGTRVHREITIGIYRHIPGTYHTSGIYRYWGMSRREAVSKVLEWGGNHIRNECFGPAELGSARAQIPPIAHVRARAPSTRSHAKCAREPPFRARLVRLRVIVRGERARGETHRQHRRTDAMAASSAHLVA